MNIAILTTWISSCGIAEYSRNLVQELLSIPHNHIYLYGNRCEKNENWSMQGSSQSTLFVERAFGVGWWGEDPRFYAGKIQDYIEMHENEHGLLDAFIVQYQSSLYEPEGLNELLSGIAEDMPYCKIIIVKHDSTVNPKHKFPKRVITISHNKNIQADYYVPMPTIELLPMVFSFGMGGRNDYKFIKNACDEIGISFSHHDARESGWLSENELFSRMNEADAIVLWYNEVPLQGQSAALRTAISSMRPVIVNDVGWFKDAPNFVTKVRTDVINPKAHLQAHLIQILHLDYIKENSFSELAKQYIRICNETKKD